MTNFTCALWVFGCIGALMQEARANNVRDHSKKDFSSISFDMKRTLKSGHRNVTLKTQIASIKAQIAALQAYHKKLGTQNKHLQTFKIELQSKINNTHEQRGKLLKLQKQIKKFEIKMIKLSLQMKILEAKIATAQTELKSLEKQFKELFKNNKNLMRTQIEGKDCADLYRKGEKKNGVYQIDPDGEGYFDVFCDMKTSGGGWNVFQRRQDGSVNFYRGWKDYKQGFGNLSSDFWLGLDKIYRLTSSRRNKLRVDMGDWSGHKAYAEYDYFAVKNETHKYQLSLGSYSGSAGDSLSYHKGMAFTTKDSDNDKYHGLNCATDHKGAWWYKGCYNSNLNGRYYGRAYYSGSGVVWYHWKNFYSLKFSEMKMKP
ncbi:angiopoietin-related protein 7-like isoform X2 [Xenia sp. Carnegie-2017]|uniref:angiopoietin-related protein 7-like isoform X2 n=1 Tax=Xenia sp. Carnegie-2017 TaxID=2897299 RepID=UPI001F042251|nr:angiopoietin-related protein 7-like isoform X2 [Xenia sp. Carnegie-2017]